jgi:anaerobic selenocysteine-containing dehydrogenase
MLFYRTTSNRAGASVGQPQLECGVLKPDQSSVESDVAYPSAGQRSVHGLCGICPGGCAVRIDLQDDRITRVAPWRGHPHGMCCPRGAHAPEIVYSPDRLLYPLKRVGARGEGGFERIGWDEALDMAAGGLQRVVERWGAPAVCAYTGRGVFDWTLCHLMTPAGVRESSVWSIFFPLGSPNTTGVGSICYVAHGVIAPAVTYGVWDVDTFADIENAEMIVVWGGNPATDSPPCNCARIVAARKRGAEVVVIDHRFTETAKLTGAPWLGIRPGTDGALALAMLHVVIEEGLYDRAFIEDWTVGFEELRAYVADFTPERAEAITWVPAEEIRHLARSIARARGASLVSYTGLEYTNSGTQNIRAVLILWALTGQLDVPGGKVIKMAGADFPINQSRRLDPPLGMLPIGHDRYPLYYHYRREAHAMELPRAILEDDPYPLRAMLIAGSSIITAYPKPNLWRRSLSALDFLMVIDRFMTADAMYADLILPSATLFESVGYMVHGDTFQIRERVIEPLGEARSDWDIVIGLANRLGYGHLYPGSSEEVPCWALAGSGVDLAIAQAHPEGVRTTAVEQRYRKWELGLLRRDGQPGFETPTGKFEIASRTLAEFGYDPLPIYVEPHEGPLGAPELAQQYPLVFNSGARIQSDFRSQHHNIPGLLKMQPAPLVTLHPRDAAARDIATGDSVWVITPRGRVRYLARVSTDIVPGVIEANMGGGGPIASPPWRDCNVNELTDDTNRDPISGFPVYKALLCEVVKA